MKFCVKNISGVSNQMSSASGTCAGIKKPSFNAIRVKDMATFKLTTLFSVIEMVMTNSADIYWKKAIKFVEY